MSRLYRCVVLAFAPLLFSAGAAAQCSVSLSSSSQSVVAAGGTGSFSVSSAAGCSWSSTSSVPWITISFGQSGTQNGSVGFSVVANDSNTARTGTITVNDKTFTISQAAATCSYQLAPSSATFPASGGNGTVELTTLKGCTWQATTLANWITIASPSGSGPGTISFSVAPGTAQRTATIQVQTERFTVTQTGPCSFSVTSAIPPVSGNGGTVNVAVTASTNTCERTTTSQADWIKVTSGATGTGSGTVVLTVSPNPSNAARQGTITINDSPLTIAQLGSSCTFTLVPDRGTALQTGGVGTISVQTQAGCPWTAASQVDWVQVTGTASGTGNGSVSYSVGQNLSADVRYGGIAIGPRVFQLTQSGLGCTIRIDNNQFSVPAEGGSGSFTISSLTSCAWQATTSDSWLKLTPTSGMGPGDVAFEAQPNGTNQIRIGRVFVGAAQVQITQAAGACRVSVGQSAVSVPNSGGSGNVAITANCAWTATSSADWIVLTGPRAGSGNATLQYQVQPNTGADDRTGTITINGQAVSIFQPGQRCSLTLSTSSANLPARGGTGTFSVTGGSSCSWTASARDGWLKTDFSIVNGSGLVRYTAPANTTGGTRTTVVTVSGQEVTVVQPAISLAITREGVVNAASFGGAGSVAPGEMITIFGSGFGPSLLAALQLSANGQSITSQVGDTRVLFDGVPSPMVYSVDGQLSAIVPYAVAGRQSTVLEVEYLGVTSNALTLHVSATAPGVFSLAQNGKGQGAVLNQDNSANGPGSAAAARNSVIQIFATGEGQTAPEGVDGKLAATPLPKPVAPVRVFVGGVEAVVTYAGGAPGLVAGVIQVNARIPQDSPTGDAVSLEVRVGDAPSQSGITVGIR